MGQDARLRREIYRVLLAMSAGEATEQQCAWLDQMVREEPQARQIVVDALTQISDLEWEVRESAPELQRVVRKAPTGAAAPNTRSTTRQASRRMEHGRSSLWKSWGPVAGAFALGVAATVILVVRLGFQRLDDAFVVDRLPTVNAPAVARLVSNTSFMIDAEGGHAINAGDEIHAGKSVTLFDGVAEVEFDHAVSVRLKGPAMLAIDDHGVAHLKYGRMIVTNQGNRRFRLEAPLASATIEQNSYVGVDGHGDDIFFYAFEGAATLSPQESTAEQIVSAGKAWRVRRGARSDILLQEQEYESTAFDFDLLMASDKISVSDQYVKSIVAARPAAYWRFEEEGAGVVKNELGDSHALALEGEGVRIVERDGSGVAEFVIRDEAACLTSHEPFDEVAGGDYSIELWVKPSHFQWGTLAALLDRAFDAEGEIDRHAMLVELHGANAPPEGQAKSIRFLHRSPPSDQRGGTSCFSSAFYRTQAWQHVAAVKRGDELNLYLNGELVASAVDATRLPKGLQLVVGQLFSFGTVRPFVGHIDEMALYGRALSLDEIRQHVEIVRPTPHAAPTAPAESRSPQAAEQEAKP